MVEITERKVENQMQFWALLGPFLVLLSIAILLFRVSDHWYIPFSALIGIPLCVKWQMKGMTLSLICLSLLLLLTYQDLELGDRYWHIGLSLAMAFSFIILTLSSEEAQGLLQKLQLESTSRLDNFTKLDLKWKESERAWEQEKESFLTSIKTLTADLTKIQEDKQTFYKLAQLAKDELVLIRTQHSELLQDLAYKKQQISQLHERIEETELTIQGFLNTDSEQQIEQLTKCLEVAEEEKEVLKERLSALEIEWQCNEKEKTCLAHELQHSQEREHALTVAREKELKIINEIQSSLKETEDSYLQLKEEKERIIQSESACRQELEHYHVQINSLTELNKQLNETLTDSQQQQLNLQKQLEQTPAIPFEGKLSNEFESKYLQLREQFQEKSDVLDATRRELFYLQEKLLKWEKDLDENRFSDLSPTETRFQQELIKLGNQFEEMKRLYQEEIDQLTYTISCLLKQL